MDKVESSSKQISEHDEVTDAKRPSNSTSNKKDTVSLLGLFAVADNIDYFLMFVGSIGACIQGAVLPVFFVLFGRMIDSLGKSSSDPHRSSSEVSQVFSFYLVMRNMLSFLSTLSVLHVFIRKFQIYVATIEK